MENEKIETTAEEKLQEAIQKIWDLAKAFSEWFAQAFEAVITVVKKAMQIVRDKIAPAFTNKRVIHLAKHSKKARVRKKNVHRIIKSMQRGLMI